MEESNKKELNFKIEAKWGWYRVDVEHGEYSDWSTDCIVIAANSKDEAWERVKQLYDLGQLPVISSSEPIKDSEFGLYPKDHKGWPADVTITMLEVYHFTK